MFSYSKWLELPITTRIAIATKFGIAKVGPTHVVNDKVVQDGYDLRTLESVFSPEKMREVTGLDESDPSAVFDVFVVKALEEPKIIESKPITQPEVATPKKRGRPKKQA